MTRAAKGKAVEAHKRNPKKSPLTGKVAQKKWVLGYGFLGLETHLSIWSLAGKEKLSDPTFAAGTDNAGCSVWRDRASVGVGHGVHGSVLAGSE